MEKRDYLKEIDGVIEEADPADYDKAVLILPDQINLNVWPEWIHDEKPLLILIESYPVHRTLPYHKKRLTYLLSSLRHFAVECSSNGFPVHYQSTDQHYDKVLKDILDGNKELALSFMNPSEWDSRERLQELRKKYENRVTKISNTFFFADPDDWKQKIEPGYRMEYFYRDMRKKTGYLMNGDEPEGGEWNYDENNRESLPSGYDIPEPTRFQPDDITLEVMEMVDEKFPDHFGKTDHFYYATSRKQAMELLDEFIDNRLDDFGPYEDAMASDEPLLFHSGLSPYMNNGLLLPWEICERAIEAYRENDEIPINSVEGLVRQILGWREFVHIYYEAMMPEVRDTNFMNFNESLPKMYWSGETRMHCMKQSLKPVIEQGYSHHIQRLMVLSNFSNLTKTDPRELNEWFRFAYVDAHEWVVLPNVLGMSTFADGGVLASKPYVSSGNYINKMSDYCKSCEYSISKKTGEDACPFNYLYWNFVDEQRDAFEESGRNSFMVNMYEKKSEENKEAIRNSTENFLEQLKRYKNS
ncbi:cryptochrome/photolyase family protein [Balneolaceae bacterium YR4-1]|uniref:Cryptochrome/photolyase family protein n=1 Tax=Halalkalibaculum roseum TaxID=2709311 RepID=A0A6M1SUS2_9BACT|nr:cryptochrome/photolyase family protein [Halalkalibaculum roseum]NGP75876.1 cryptochrome/photolyase family protein [Halalkalibaculum roseum]